MLNTTTAEPKTGGQGAGAPHTDRRHSPPSTGRSDRRVSLLSQGAPSAPPMVIVFRTPDGTLSHAHCGHPLEFQGRRAEIELDFYCRHCMEHVTLPDCVLSRVPLGQPTLAA